MTTLTPERLAEIEKYWNDSQDTALTLTTRQYHKDHAAFAIPNLVSEIKRLREELDGRTSELSYDDLAPTFNYVFDDREKVKAERDKLSAQLSDAQAALKVLQLTACHSHGCYNPPETPRAAPTLKHQCADECEIRIITAALHPGRE